MQQAKIIQHTRAEIRYVLQFLPADLCIQYPKARTVIVPNAPDGTVKRRAFRPEKPIPRIIRGVKVSGRARERLTQTEMPNNNRTSDY
jgi:hypothetical protein